MSKQAPEPECGTNDFMYVHSSWAIGDLEGKILTFIDASISDPVQRKAMKDLVRPMIWTWAVESNVSSDYEIKSLGLQNSTRR